MSLKQNHYFRGIMAIRDCQVVNANYERVLAVMDKFLGERYRNVCSCPRCMNDIVAIALNYLPPHYIVEGGIGKEYGSPWVMVESAVSEAIDRVVEYPNHSRMEAVRPSADARGSDPVPS